MPGAPIDLAGLNVTAEDFLAAVLDTTAQPIWVVDPNDQIRFANPAAIAALGYDGAEELFGRLSHATIHYRHPDGTPYPAADCPMLLPRATGETVANDLDWFFRRDGSMFPVSYVSVPIEMPDGRGAVLAFTNIEERLRAERELRERDAILAAQLASLRRVATLVTGGAASAEVFAAIAREVAEVLDLRLVAIFRYADDEAVTVLGGWGDRPHPFQAGTRWPLDGLAMFQRVLRSARPVRIDDFADLQGPIAAAARDIEIHSGAYAPIIVDGDVWGVMGASPFGDRRLPDGIEHRLVEFTELIATSISNTASREQIARLADEQAALRRVATLVAQDVAPSELFGAVTREVGTLLGADLAGLARFEDDAVVTVAAWAAAGEHPPVPRRWPMQAGDPATTIAETRRPVRWDDWAGVPGPIASFIRDEVGVRSTVGCPIMVEGRLWGAMAAHSKRSTPLPADTEARISQFTDLVGTAIANAEARAEVARLAQEQTALRRVATVVARDAAQAEVFKAIAEECAQLFDPGEIGMVRYEGGRDQVVVASSGAFKEVFPFGSRQPLGGMNAASRVFETGRPVRIDDYGTASGAIGDAARSIGVRSVVATPIVVEGRLWGAMVTGTSQDEPMAPETESRLAQFTELMATAVANTESHARADRLTDEQAALRRVATLVAKEAPPAEVFAKVAEELANVLGDVDCSLFRDEGDGTASVVALSGARVSAGVRVGTRLTVDGDGVIASVLREGRPCRIGAYSAAAGAIAQRGRELGIRSAVGCPIVVGGRIWGAMAAARYEAEAFPPGSETHIWQFAELVATAIANAAARAEVERLAEEQAALRRVAMLVADGAAPAAVFDAVAAEMKGLLGADGVTLSRYEPDEEVTIVAHRGLNAELLPPGTRTSHQGENVTSLVRRSERPARMENYDGTHGAVAELSRSLGVRSTVASPIVVDGRLWGVTIANWGGEESPPADTEERMAQFAELLDTAIANADSRDQLTASRARLLIAGDEARRRVVRDLHDGAQQRQVHTIVTLRLAQRALEENDAPAAESLISEALEHAEQGNTDLRELAHGILPGVLTGGGLRAGVGAVVSRLDLPVDVDVPAERFPAEIEASAYFIVAEALTNVVKHSHAKRAEVRASVDDGMLRVEVRDDGIGGADPEAHGLVGMADRVTALGGRLEIESPAGGGTFVAATLPISAR